ncbi:MAG: hypothetical protein AB7G13_33705 [Lautropia sp.]
MRDDVDALALKIRQEAKRWGLAACRPQGRRSKGYREPGQSRAMCYEIRDAEGRCVAGEGYTLTPEEVLAFLARGCETADKRETAIKPQHDPHARHAAIAIGSAPELRSEPELPTLSGGRSKSDAYPSQSASGRGAPATTD